MDWNNPLHRAKLAAQLGPEAYAKALRKQIQDTTIAFVNGHRIRTIETERFGTLYLIGSTRKAHPDYIKAKALALKQPPGLDKPDQ